MRAAVSLAPTAMTAAMKAATVGSSGVESTTMEAVIVKSAMEVVVVDSMIKVAIVKSAIEIATDKSIEAEATVVGPTIVPI